jgi:cation diffusion facilitator CzcD-associated flavoprotein CzcO
MASSSTDTVASQSRPHAHALPSASAACDAIIIGAGVSGLCALYQIRTRFPTWKVRVIDAASDVGGTWYWNSYPGCRFDSESLSYAISFDKDLLNEWHWKEAYSPQPETLKYFQRFAEKHQLKDCVLFDTTVQSAHWNEGEKTWTLADDKGGQHVARFVVSAMGFLSSPTLPAICGIETFKGEVFHTSRWPRDLDVKRDFAGKRIGIIGTGATGIQIITALSKEPAIKSVTVFQRTANWAAPLRNREISVEEMDQLKKTYPDIFDKCFQSASGFVHLPDHRKWADLSEEERIAHWEKLYNAPGFGKWLSVFADTYTSRAANAHYSDFMANKIRQRVVDPETAESLIPKTHGFGTRRVPLESGYFEAYNKEHIHLVDLRKTPIGTVSPTGIQTSDGNQHVVDVLICATGFDAITGAFAAIDFHGKENRPMAIPSDSPDGQRAVWPDHRPQTYLGISVPDMPNFFMVLGPHQPYGNATRNVEYIVSAICDLLQYTMEHGYRHVEATQGAAKNWVQHIEDCARGQVLMNEVDSWMTGVNTNVKGKTTRIISRYCGEAKEFRRRVERAAAANYEGFIFE